MFQKTSFLIVTCTIIIITKEIINIFLMSNIWHSFWFLFLCVLIPLMYFIKERLMLIKIKHFLNYVVLFRVLVIYHNQILKYFCPRIKTLSDPYKVFLKSSLTPALWDHESNFHHYIFPTMTKSLASTFL